MTAVPVLAFHERRAWSLVNCCRHGGRRCLHLSDGVSGLRQDAMMRLECARQSLAQAVQEVPSISNLDCMRQRFPDGFGIGAGAIPADNLRTGVRAQSGGYGFTLPVGQEIDHPVRLKVAQYRGRFRKRTISYVRAVAEA